MPKAGYLEDDIFGSGLRNRGCAALYNGRNAAIIEADEQTEYPVSLIQPMVRGAHGRKPRTLGHLDYYPRLRRQ
jgi:hypothetical protein